jgi:hypothetical protein
MLHARGATGRLARARAWCAPLELSQQRDNVAARLRDERDRALRVAGER